MKSQNITFRLAKIDELSSALSLLKEAALWLQTKNTQQWSFWINPSEERINWIKEGFESKEFYFVFINEIFVGMFRLMYFDEQYWGKRPDRLDKAAYVHSLTIKREFGGQGLGALFLQEIEEKLRSEGIFKFRLDCMQSNTGLCNYYESQGFLKVGEVEMSWAVQNLYEKDL